MGCLLIALVICLIVQAIRCHIAVNDGKERLASSGAITAKLSYGEMTYVDHIPKTNAGDGNVILSIHGMFGGYDQAYDTCRDFESNYRMIAPSRFGYLGSDVMENGTPAMIAAAYVALLNNLGIEKVYSLATSAGVPRQFDSHLIIQIVQRGLYYIVLRCRFQKKQKDPPYISVHLHVYAITSLCFAFVLCLSH